MAPKHDEFKNFVLDQLSGLPDLTPRAMFGGYGLYQHETFFGIIHTGRLYFKTTGQTRSDYLASGMKPFRPNPKQTLKNYYEVPVDTMENTDQLIIWAKRALFSRETGISIISLEQR